mgnify:CR=1 FL=1
MQSQVLNLLKDLQKQYGLTYLFIGHDLSVINFIADRVCVMFLGHVCEVATKEELYSRPMHPYTAFLMDAIPQADPHRRNQHRPLPLRNGALPHRGSGAAGMGWPYGCLPPRGRKLGLR